MPNFVRDMQSPPATKTDLINVPSGADPTRYWAALDANFQAQIDSDLRGEIIAAQFHGLQDTPSTEASVASGVTKLRSHGGLLQVSPNGNPFVQLDAVALSQQSPGNASAQSVAGTFAPDLSKGQLFFGKLDQNATVANPVNTTQAQTGSIVRVYVQQDGTGGRSLSWGTNFKGAARVAPRQGANQLSRFDFLVKGDGTYTLLGWDAIDLAKAISPRDFGAVADGSTDDVVAVNQCLAYAATFTPPLPVVLDGQFGMQSGPALVTASNAKLIGTGRYVSGFKRSTGACGPNVLVVPNDWPAMPTRAALATGSGVAMVLDGTENYWLNFADAQTFSINGFSQICIELLMEFDSAPSSTSNLFSSQGISALSGDTRQISFQMYTNPAPVYGGPAGKLALVTQLNCGGSMAQVAPGFSSVWVTPGASTLQHVALDYDGSTLRLWVNGALQGSIAATGAVVQKYYEDMCVGASIGSWPEQTQDADMTPGAIESIRISNISRYTSSFTPPTAKFTADSHTALLHNFTNETQFTSVCQAGQPGSMFTTYIPLRRANVGSHISRVTLEEFGDNTPNWLGGGVQVYSCDTVRVRDYYGAGPMPMRMDNNCYTSWLDNVELTGTDGEGGGFLPRIGLRLGTDTGAGETRGLRITGFLHSMFSFPGWKHGHGYIAPNSTTLIPILAISTDGTMDGEDTVIEFDSFQIDDENGSSMVAAALVQNMSEALFLGGNFDMFTFGATAIQVDGCRTVRTVGTAFASKSGGNPYFQIINGNNPVDPIQIDGRRYKTIVPWITPGSEHLIRVDEKGVSQNVRPPRVAVADANYTATFADTIIAHTTLTAARSDTVPTAVPLAAGHRFVFKDESGTAGTHHITISPVSGTIDGASSVTISTNYGSVVIYTDGANYFTE